MAARVHDADLAVTGKITSSGETEIDGPLNHDGTTVGFYGTTPVAQPNGVNPRVALQNLGLGASLVQDTPAEITFTVPGTLAVGTGKARYYLPVARTVSSVRASVGTVPTGATLIVDVNKNGTTIYGTQGNRPTIAISGNTATGGTASGASFSAGDYMTIDVDQVGSTVAGADLTVTVVF